MLSCTWAGGGIALRRRGSRPRGIDLGSASAAGRRAAAMSFCHGLLGLDELLTGLLQLHGALVATAGAATRLTVVRVTAICFSRCRVDEQAGQCAQCECRCGSADQ